MLLFHIYDIGKHSLTAPAGYRALMSAFESTSCMTDGRHRESCTGNAAVMLDGVERSVSGLQ